MADMSSATKSTVKSTVIDLTLREDVAQILEEDEAVLTGEQLRELVRFEAAKLGLTYTLAVKAAAKGTLPEGEEGDELREHIRMLGLKVRS